MDEELFDLCEQVYGITNWGLESGMMHVSDGFVVCRDYRHGVGFFPKNGDFPLYTTDYILKKLPLLIERYGRFELTPMMRNTRWSAGYWTDNRLETLSAVNYTPLKALLRLVIMLNNKGIKYER